MNQQDKVRDAVTYIRSQTNFHPLLALILGSGLGEFGCRITPVCTLNAADIPHYPISSVAGHAGKLIFGYIKTAHRQSIPLLVFQGRVHFYETNDLEKVVFPVHVAKQLGIKSMLITNAAGGVNKNFSAGDLMLIQDILNLTLMDITTGSRLKRKKSKTPLLDPHLENIIRSCAQQLHIPLQEGTYCWLKGPSYETPAEIQMLQRIGIDAVGMSTVPEIQTAHQLGIKVSGISLISNLAAGISATKLSHKEVTETANQVKQTFSELMETVVLSIR
ncbi:MAG TPA: purine-nucleoside phosphorylase [Bacteroidota bacterium]|nr:purine-nucleoside phosphorylase [Bacteroidota bacterium]